MRHSSVFLGLVLCSTAALAQPETQVPVMKSSAPTMTAVQPANPVSSKPGGPIIQSISAQMNAIGVVLPNFISAQFHFVAPNGNALALHRDIIATNGSNPVPALNQLNQAINIPADAQKRGAIITVISNCDTSTSYTTYRAFIMDEDGNRSNEVRYTVHCNGG